MYRNRLFYIIGAITYVLAVFPVSVAAGSVQQFEKNCSIDSWLPHTVIVRRVTEPLKLRIYKIGEDMGDTQEVRIQWVGSADAVSVFCEQDVTTINVMGTKRPNGSREAVIVITLPSDLLSSVHVE
jgi:hypothetical protein